MSKKFQVTMSDNLVQLIDEYAELKNISRSSAISVLCSDALNFHQDKLKLSNEFQDYMKSVKNSVSDLEGRMIDAESRISRIFLELFERHKR